MSVIQSWAVALLALELTLAILRILWLLAHPLKTCSYCDRGYRGTDHHVYDGWYQRTGACCSIACQENASERAWMGSQS